MSKEYQNGQTPVHELKLIVTLIGQDDTPEALSSDICRMSMAQIGSAMDEGDLIGSMALVSVQQLQEDEVVHALEAIGNDGEFFNHGADEPFVKAAYPDEPDGRILRAQIEQGWNSESLGILRKRFISEVGLEETFARWIEAEAAAENDYAGSSMDVDPEP